MDGYDFYCESDGPEPPCHGLVRLRERITELERNYYQLIYAVQRKFPGETRHETALRYITQVEAIQSPSEQQSRPSQQRPEPDTLQVQVPPVEPL